MVFRYLCILAGTPIAAFSVVLSRSANADPTTAPGETVTEVFGEGRTGLASPDPKTGTMSYTYPFVVPSARGGRTCKQALYRTWLPKCQGTVLGHHVLHREGFSCKGNWTGD